MVKTFVFSASWWNGETPRDLRFSMEKLRNGVKLELCFMKRERKIKYVLSMHCVLLPVQNTPITIFISLLRLQTITNMTVEKSIYV